MSEAPGWIKKRWGRVLHILDVSCLETKAGYRCSRHYHDHTTNRFGVISGAVVIEEWDSYTQHTSRKTYLGPGDTYAVDAPVIHRFTVLESGWLIERYEGTDARLPIQTGDIHRLDAGGAVPSEELDQLRREFA